MTTAGVTDRQGALNAIEQHTENLSEVSVVLTDGGYTGQPFANAVSSLIGANVHVVKRSELHTFPVIPKR